VQRWGADPRESGQVTQGQTSAGTGAAKGGRLESTNSRVRHVVLRTAAIVLISRHHAYGGERTETIVVQFVNGYDGVAGE